MTEQKASIGRIVIFNHASQRSSTDNLLKSAALIIRVDEGNKVDLAIFHQAGGILFKKGIDQGSGVDEWSWPQRV